MFKPQMVSLPDGRHGYNCVPCNSIHDQTIICVPYLDYEDMLINNPETENWELLKPCRMQLLKKFGQTPSLWNKQKQKTDCIDSYSVAAVAAVGGGWRRLALLYRGRCRCCCATAESKGLWAAAMWSVALWINIIAGTGAETAGSAEHTGPLDV